MIITTHQLPAIYANQPKTLQRIEKVLINSTADIVCFPECFLAGYFRQTPEAFANRIELTSTHFAHVLATLAPYKPTIILGLIEREGDDLFNTAVVIEQGELRAARYLPQATS